MVPESEIRALLEEILSRPEYRGSGPSWYEAVWRGIQRVLNSLFSFFDPDYRYQGADDFLSLVIFVVFILVIVAIVFFVFKIRMNAMIRRRGLTEDIGLNPEQWEARYAQALAVGDLNEAFRCRWRQTLAILDESGRVVERRGLTTGEAVQEADLSSPAFAEFTERFDQSMYAGKRAGQHEIELAVEWQRAVVREVKR